MFGVTCTSYWERREMKTAQLDVGLGKKADQEKTNIFGVKIGAEHFSIEIKKKGIGNECT